MTLSRRDCLGFGLTLAGGFPLPTLLRLRAASGPTDTAVIFVQLGGGAAQHETYDPKPDAPVEVRGPFGPTRTSVPGVAFCDLMPRQAALMQHVAIVRSIAHHEASHIALHVVETGYFLRNPGNSLRGEMPSIGATVSRVRGPGPDGLPASVSLPRMFAYSGPHHLGGEHAAFNVEADPNDPEFRVANLALAKGLAPEKVHDRLDLLRSLDRTAPSDPFRQRALDLITGSRVRQAFDLGREPEALRERYGRNAFGQRLLLARRLAEAGVPFLGVRMFDWDDHQDLGVKMKKRAPEYDAGLAALVQDLVDRGLNRRILVVAMGEFGRTPKVNVQGGRDHWPGVSSVLLAGGAYRMGQVIGATDAHGATVTRALYPPQAVLVMVYRHLGIDPGTHFLDFTGRPRPVLEERDPIRELL